MTGPRTTPTGSLFDNERLRATLAQTYTPEGVEIWIRHAVKLGWPLDFALLQAEATHGMVAT